MSRSIIESEIWKKPPLYLKVWIWLLCNAQFKSYKNLERGQLSTSIEEIRQACSYYSGYRKEMPTKKQIYNILEWLRNPYGRDNGRNADNTMIDTTAVTHGIVINICNFNKYQNPNIYGGNDEGNNGETMDGTRTGQKGKDINEKSKKKDKNNINNNNIPPTIEEVRAYCLKRENRVNPEQFMDYYESKGWLIGKSKMKDWKAAVRTWERRNHEQSSKGNGDKFAGQKFGDYL